ncbi:MAG: haloacid dehalogenase-like hydrolase [Deltaproteobacteria bacterium]|nr:haloacid dehalogenase-like hydrolase [Deltaproteobacteria bacterium]
MFDIDGTLLSTAGAGRRALAQAFFDLFGFTAAMDGVRLHGATDPKILEQVFQKHRGNSPSAAESEAVLARYLALLALELERTQGGYQVLPGGEALVSALVATGRHAVGLATGNVEAGARLKLRPGGLDQKFRFGGFGSDAGDRAELVAHAIRRGQAELAQLGRPAATPQEIFVLGDTEQDVMAARRTGVVAIGILAGSGVPDDLRQSQPDLLCESMWDPALWAALSLERP